MNATRVTATLVALVLSLVLSPRVRANDAYYEGDDPNPAPLGYTDAVLTSTIQQEMKRKRVSSIKNLATGATDVAAFARVEKIALLYVLPTKPGAELDVIVEDGGKFTAVETSWDGEVVTFKTGEARAQLYGKASSTEEIQKKFGTGPFVESGAKWDNDSLYVVETALATLSPEELAGVAELPFHRMVKDPSNKATKGTVAAMYVPERSQIELYDYAMVVDKRRFVGTVEKPTPLSVFTLVHECGHAVSRKGARESRHRTTVAKQEYDEVNAKLIAEKKTYDADKATYARTRDQALGKSISERTPVLKQLVADLAEKKKKFDAAAAEMTTVETKGSAIERALDAKLPFKKSVTNYARTSIAESFAECLALFKLDKKALERAAPGIPAWFESPEYVALVKGP